MKNKVVPITAGIVLIVIVAGVFFYNQNQAKNADISPTPTPLPTSTPTPTPEMEISSEWETFESENLEISLKHPPEMQERENQDGSVSFTLLGPTQTEGTEVYDGIILNFNTGTYETETFEEFVTTKHQEQVNDPIVSDVSELSETKINGKTGYSFSIVGLGEFTIMYLPMQENNYLRISMLVEDPEDQGFQETVDTILSSINY